MTTATALPARRTACTGPCAGLCTEDGFAAAYREHRPRMLARARALVGDAALAEDAVQDAFLRAWTACGSFDPAASPPMISWLMTITRNVVIDLVRAQAARPRTAHSPVDAGIEPAEPRSAVDDALLRSVLVDALATVSDEHRDVVVQTLVHDRSYADVAAELGVPVGTVKSRVFYALRGLRGVLEPPAMLLA